jgi:hypothetical protein
VYGRSAQRIDRSLATYTTFAPVTQFASSWPRGTFGSPRHVRPTGGLHSCRRIATGAAKQQVEPSRGRRDGLKSGLKLRKIHPGGEARARSNRRWRPVALAHCAGSRVMSAIVCPERCGVSSRSDSGFPAHSVMLAGGIASGAPAQQADRGGGATEGAAGPDALLLQPRGEVSAGMTRRDASTTRRISRSGRSLHARPASDCERERRNRRPRWRSLR